MVGWQGLPHFHPRDTQGQRNDIMKISSLQTSSLFLFPRVVAALSVVCVVVVAGCGDAGNRVTGSVTFDGRPVPAGKVYFKPDGEAGNTGATGYADIVDGRYDTAAEGARNVGTGAMIISVEGNEPQGAAGGEDADVTSKVLFLGYEIRQEIASGDVTLDIAVPADASLPPSSEPEQQFISP